MKILVLNSGSSSIKCQYFIQEQSVASIIIEQIGEKKGVAHITYQEQDTHFQQPIPHHHAALQLLFTMLQSTGVLLDMQSLDAVGHRVVHGGTFFDSATHITPKVITMIRSLIPLAPLHNPANLEAIEVIATHYPELTQVAVFDTAFHQTMPDHAARYPLPYDLSHSAKIRRYGFHGTSHLYVAKEAAKMLGRELKTLNLITLHLGNGASATAIQSGISIDTSMGMTPLEGLMMGTRCGDIDPAIVAYLHTNNGLEIGAIDHLLNYESGFKGVCGTNDVREILQKVNKGEQRSQLALEMYVYRIKKYIGAYCAALGSVDAIIFTGGVGEHAAKIRELVCRGLEKTLGLKIDASKNATLPSGNQAIHDAQSTIQLLVIPTNEEREIARQTAQLLKEA